MQLPSGFLLDKFGVRKIGRISTLIWSAACFCSAGAIGLRSFFASRLLLGVGEAPTFPGSSKAVGYWFPRSERSLGDRDLRLGRKTRRRRRSAVDRPPALALRLALELRSHRNHQLFLFRPFFLFYRNPNEDKRLTTAERQFIVAGGAHIEGFRDATQRQNRKSRSLTCSARRKSRTRARLRLVQLHLLSAVTWLPSYLSNSWASTCAIPCCTQAVPWGFGAFTEFSSADGSSTR